MYSGLDQGNWKQEFEATTVLLHSGFVFCLVANGGVARKLNGARKQMIPDSLAEKLCSRLKLMLVSDRGARYKMLWRD